MADLLIKGMDMPKDCPMCKLAHFNKRRSASGAARLIWGRRPHTFAPRAGTKSM